MSKAGLMNPPWGTAGGEVTAARPPAAPFTAPSPSTAEVVVVIAPTEEAATVGSSSRRRNLSARRRNNRGVTVVHLWTRPGDTPLARHTLGVTSSGVRAVTSRKGAWLPGVSVGAPGDKLIVGGSV
ncbi:hypothetical protein JTE90_022781 [Oedothorax gibbosus]|uniref:Uncharacterized protein n=1 Tax=Oedothorax gibbosus TaxID=931172 RepID=A0AAV6U860_9ARAC|nr:hypothetical protein JTE90_022781 [Oedothorax gibbosus]